MSDDRAEFVRDPADAASWSSLATAGAELERLFEFDQAHQLVFDRGPNDRHGQPTWRVRVFRGRQAFGWLRRYIIRGGEAKFL